MAREFANTSGSPNIDYITYSGIPPVAGLGACSFVVRVAADSDTPSYGVILHEQDNATLNSAGLLRLETQQNMLFLIRNSSVEIPSFPFSFDGTMRSIVATFDGTRTPKIIVYVDGVSQTMSTQPANTTIGSGQTTFGVGGISGYRLNGRLAEAAIYNRALTQAEATMHANGMSCLKCPRGLIFYAPLIREVHDIVGGLTGTITGTTVSAHPRIYL